MNWHKTYLHKVVPRDVKRYGKTVRGYDMHLSHQGSIRAFVQEEASKIFNPQNPLLRVLQSWKETQKTGWYTLVYEGNLVTIYSPI